MAIPFRPSVNWTLHWNDFPALIATPLGQLVCLMGGSAGSMATYLPDQRLGLLVVDPGTATTAGSYGTETSRTGG